MNYQRTSKPVCATSIDTGEQIIFPSINQASRHLSINPGQISKCCQCQYTALSKNNGETYEFAYTNEDDIESNIESNVDIEPNEYNIESNIESNEENLTIVSPDALMQLLELICEFMTLYEDEPKLKDSQTLKVLREKGISTLNTMLNRDIITLEQYRDLNDKYFESIDLV